MALNSTFTPKASLTEAPTNLKEAIDWVLRVTGKDGKKLSTDECICGLAAAVTDLLQSVELEYHGYQGDTKDAGSENKGATSDKVKEHLHNLFSLVQGLGGTSVVRTYIDQLAQVLSALVGWSKIEKCWEGRSDGKCKPNGGNKEHHGKDSSCKYLLDVEDNKPCDKCGCMKWNDPNPGSNEGHHLGRRCRKCSDSGGSSTCGCNTGGAETCKCECTIGTYRSAYNRSLNVTFVEVGIKYDTPPTWKHLMGRHISVTTDGSEMEDKLTPSQRRHQCAQTLLGSVCLIWSGMTYMYWTGKWAQSSPRWNNHILDGSGLDDGTLSQWLQALGFPRGMLNNYGPGNRWDAIIWDGFREKLFWGFTHPSGLYDSDVHDYNDNTAKYPAGMNFAGFVHTIHRDSFNSDATVFPKDGTASGNTDQDINQHKRGALFKLYILSCAYFTGLQRRTTESTTHSTPRNPKTIREILYWLSALPYSQAYKDTLDYAKKRLEEVLKKPDGSGSTTSETQLKFTQQGRNAPITVDQYNLFAHFQAVTQYCPLVLIGIQGGLHSTDTTTPAIHALYANSQCHFTYPTVSIQAYNQVVHYIRALFYQLYFLRKQCAVKVTCGGKWRECRYGKDVVSKGVISWMCLGCDPMEHDRKSRVKELKKTLDALVDKVETLGGDGDDGRELVEVFKAIGDVVVQLGNAQEALERKKGEEITKVKDALGAAKEELETEVEDKVVNKMAVDTDLKTKIEALTKKSGGNGILGKVEDALGRVAAASEKERDYSNAKDRISEAIHKVREILTALKELAEQDEEKVKNNLKDDKIKLLVAISELKSFLKIMDDMFDIVGSTRCVHCQDHSNKCGKKPVSRQCPQCHQPTTTGVPSPLQAFLEDQLPGFSCVTTMVALDQNKDYPLASSHLGHCGGSGQCCPLPMGFRGQFQKGSISNMIGSRLYGILYFFCNENMMQSCVYTLVRVTAALSATTPQVLGDVFGFFRGGVGNPLRGKPPKNDREEQCQHDGNPGDKGNENKYFCGWCASGLRDEVKGIQWIPLDSTPGGHYMEKVGKALIEIKGEKGSGITTYSSATTTTSNLSALAENCQYLSPLTGELYTAVSATFGGTYLSWVLYLSDALEGGLQSLSDAFQQIECRGCKGQCDPNKCKKGSHGGTDSAQCNCSSIVSCTGVLPVLYRHGFSYGNPFNLEGYQQRDGDKDGQYDITNSGKTKKCHQFLESLGAVIKKKKEESDKDQNTTHPLTELLKQVGKLQYDIRLPWIFVLTLAWLVAVLYLAFGAIWPLDWTHMRSHWLRGGAHQWQCMWYKVMTGRKGMELVEYFGREGVEAVTKDNSTLRTVLLSGAKGWGGG